MSNIVFIDHARFHLIDDAAAVRHIDAYQKVRDEINRRNNPLSGGPDWAVVKVSCETLAKGPGIDLLLCGYYTVACLKMQGLAGYANGVELLCCCLSNLPKPDVKSAKMRKEVLDWVNARVVRELKDLRPNHEALRDLYRCERFCERMHAILELQQPDYVVDFEGVGFAIFEHIDRLETQYHSLLKRHTQTEQVEQVRSQKRSRVTHVAAFISGVLGVVMVYGAVTYLPFFNSISYATNLRLPALHTPEQVNAFQQANSPAKLEQLSNEIVPLYREAIEQKMARSFESARVEAQQVLDALLQLYPQTESVLEVDQAFADAKREALQQTERFMERFSETRTKMANIALLAQKGKLTELQRQTKSLEEFAISLSPIYGRAAYVEELLKKGDVVQAEQEFMILKQRLNNLSWKMAELDKQFEHLTVTHNQEAQAQ
ncbi:type VI secretion system ImpA family N-terminal domain-containing protein [Vibrio anguillarum]|uniref:type VI secretion system ImpA family N-terminal domain-containing protein n=1 Tax=Vibrio anguillarum TaxID=55601 RepID=UPI00169AF47B|nr:type VI secretion system ImpA family N-terminal domain-containing protein [Vibrio anguillarum]MCC4236402.1 type VI secretion system ImpA family N-terminal domain-containing protein [Vibrio anguillarum]MDT3846933.1 type VI secretion system ImpA family N-terminal domain-containing protein [Vibrio anguillarum]NOI04535.1 type VI secretion protein [Vibrio anguillarum]